MIASLKFWSGPSGDAKRPSQRSIPSLDGLRALSVMMVILAHFMGWSTLPEHGILHMALGVIGQGGLGVSTFFVISGFLITTLLLNEMDAHGGVNLRRFYFRRSLRIFPPYYVYLVAAAIVAHLQNHPIPWGTLLTAAAYVSNYYPYLFSHPESVGWYVGHTWSLSVEEQFYLFWPLLLIVLSRRAALKFGIFLLVLVPLLRELTVLLAPVYEFDGQWYRLFHTTIDILMTGCILAFLVRLPNFQAQVQRYLRPGLLLTACTYLLFSTFLIKRTPTWFEALFGVTLTSLSIAILLLFVVVRHDLLPGRILNWAPLRHIGTISYSLYLWQQLFLGPYHAPSRLGMVLAAFACAELSYWLVERPSLRMRGKLEKRLHWLGIENEARAHQA